MARGENTSDHPGRKVHRERYGPMQIRAEEYDRARSGQMGPEEAKRVDINLNKLGGATHRPYPGGPLESVSDEEYMARRAKFKARGWS